MVIHGDCLVELRKIRADSIDCVITSPPYWSLRDYGVEGQLGLEDDFNEYIVKLCDIFDEVRRVIKPTGTCWVNMGDTYSTQSGAMRQGKFGPKETNQSVFVQPKSILPTKCLVQIPARFGIEMTNRGWVLRNEIIWHKSNAMPQSMRDRFTVDYEKIFLFVKSTRYYFKQQMDDATTIHGQRNKRSVWNIPTKPFKRAHFAVFPENLVEPMIDAGCPEFVCTNCNAARILITNYSSDYSKREQAHAPNSCRTKVDSSGWLPPTLLSESYIDCGCYTDYESGIVLDPFCGSGTTGVVAKKLNRRFIGIDLNKVYVAMAEDRINNTPVQNILF